MIVITGGAGFIGSAMLRHLNGLGRKDIIIVDNLGSSEKWRNLVKGQYFDYIHRDKFIDLIRKKSLPFSIEGIAHLGACSATTEKNADFLMENNFHYSRDLASFALENGVRFINASSAATYGAGERGFSVSRDSMEKLKPLNMYGYSKHLFDLWLIRNGLDSKIASLKFFNVYGPNEYHKGDMQSVVLKFWREIRMGGKASLFASNTPDVADGEQKRDFVYVKDCVSLMAWLLLERKDICGIHNIGSGLARSYNDLANAVFNALKIPPRLEYIPFPAKLEGKYQNYTRADMDWLKEVGYEKKFVSLEEGVKDYVNNYLEKKDPYL